VLPRHPLPPLVVGLRQRRDAETIRVGEGISPEDEATAIPGTH
jgi:hypothetical protein